MHSLHLLFLLTIIPYFLFSVTDAALDRTNPRCRHDFFKQRNHNSAAHGSSSSSSSSSHRRFLSETTTTTTTTTKGAKATIHTTNTTTLHYGESTHAHASAQEVGYFALCLFIGILSKKCIAPKLCFNVFPYTVLLLMTGLFIGATSIFSQWDDSKLGFAKMNPHCHLGPKQELGVGSGCDLKNPNVKDGCVCNNIFDWLNVNILHDISPHVILYIFLPPLIFESAFFMDIHIFIRSFRGIFALAVLGVTVSTLVTGFFLQYVMSYWASSCVDYSPFANFDTAMMMGAMLSATDPVAVVGILKSLGASPQLGTLIEGESLLNDGTAYAMFLVFQARAEYAEVNNAMPELTMAFCTQNATADVCLNQDLLEEQEGSGLALQVLTLIFVGPIIGYFVGFFSLLIVELIYNDVIVETSMTVLAAYASWCLAEFFKSSGVLAVVVTGLYMSHGRGLAFTEKAKHFMGEFWELVGYLLNTLVFIISGTVIGRKWADDSNQVSRHDLAVAFILWLWIHVARACAIFVAQPFVNKQVGGDWSLYDFNWRHSMVMWWGGLRGAVGLALGLIVAESPYWQKGQYSGIPESRKVFYRDGVLFNIGFVATLTLVVNGTTMGTLVKYLGLNKTTSEIAERNLQRIIHELDKSLRSKIKKLTTENSKARKDKSYHGLAKQVSVLDGRTSHLINSVSKRHSMTSSGVHTTDSSRATMKINTTHKPHTSVDSSTYSTETEGLENVASPTKRPTLSTHWKDQATVKGADSKSAIASHTHVNHHEFEHVDWQTVYQYMPVESPAVYKRRLNEGEIQDHWGQTGFKFCRIKEDNTTGCRFWCGTLINCWVHKWCACCLFVPSEIKSCLNQTFCCGKCYRDHHNIENEQECCGCLGPAKTTFLRQSSTGVEAEGPELPQRLQNRWTSYKESFARVDPTDDQYSFRQHSRDAKMESNALSAAFSRRRRSSELAKNGHPKRLTKMQKSILRQHSSSMDMSVLKHQETKRRWSLAARKSILANKNGSFASMAMEAKCIADLEQSSKLAQQQIQEKGETKTTETFDNSTIVLEMLGLENERDGMDNQDLDQNEFNKCKTIEERKTMLKTLNDLGKARQQYCRFVKEKYWHVYEEGLLDKAAFRDLADAEDAMIDMTDSYFVTLNHHIAPILQKDEALVDTAWSTFQWEDFVVKGELQSFTRTLQNLTNVPESIIFLSSIRCCSCLMKRHLYFFVSRARDIAANFVHAHEAVIRHIEHNKLFPSEIAEHIICEAEFQIMAAKTVLHNIDEVFPEIAAHLQTIRASRYLLRQEESKIKKYLRSGELSNKEHDNLLDAVLKSLQKLASHPKPQTLTPNFQKLLMESDRHKETFGRVLNQLSLEESYGLLQSLAVGAQMVYLRAGDLVYEQGSSKDHTGHNNAGMGIYYVARGAVTSVWVPGQIRKNRKHRENEYLLELHRIRKAMLQSLISKKRLLAAKKRSESRDSDMSKISDGPGPRATSELFPNSSMSGLERHSSFAPTTRKSLSRSNTDDGTIGYMLKKAASAPNIKELEKKEESKENKQDEQNEIYDTTHTFHNPMPSNASPNATPDATTDTTTPTTPDAKETPSERFSLNPGTMATSLSHSMESELKASIFTILEQTTEGQDTLADQALQNLMLQIPGLDNIMKHFKEKKKEDDANKSNEGDDVTDVITAEEDYVRTMLAPTISFQEEMKEHGGDFDGDGHISQHEVDTYRQVQLLSQSNEKVDLLDTHMMNHMFGEYEVMTRTTTRQHSVECQGVVIAFYISPDHMLKLCSQFPELEEEMWKRAAVTAAKLRMHEPPNDYRHRATKEMRIAFQNGRVSSPITRHSRKYRQKWNIEKVCIEDGETLALPSSNHHVLFLRTKYHDKNRHLYSTNARYDCTGEDVTKGRDFPLVSGPTTVKIHPDEVALIYTLDNQELKRGVGGKKRTKFTFRAVSRTVNAVKRSFMKTRRKSRKSLVELAKESKVRGSGSAGSEVMDEVVAATQASGIEMITKRMEL